MKKVTDVLPVAGLAAACAAAFLVAVPLGLLALAVSCFVAEWRYEQDE